MGVWSSQGRLDGEAAEGVGGADVLLHLLLATQGRAHAYLCIHPHVPVPQIPEVLSEEVLQKMHAGPKTDDPVIHPHDLPEADGFLIGYPTR